MKSKKILNSNNLDSIKWHITVSWEAKISSNKLLTKHIKNTAKKTLELAKPIYKTTGLSELSIHLVTDKTSHKLNLNYRKKDKPTDVLSFSAIEGSKTPMPGVTEIGELVISIDTAITQAKQYNWSLEQELKRLVIHGCLHLLGYDHEKVEKSIADKMRREERRIFRLVGVS